MIYGEKKKKIVCSVLGKVASDVVTRAELVTNTWGALEEAIRIGWKPFATLEAEAPTGKKGIVQLATIRSRKAPLNQMLCNLAGLDAAFYQKTIDFLKNRVEPNDVLSESFPLQKAKGFVTFLVRKENVVELLAAYFKQVVDMPDDFKLAVTEFVK